MGTDGREALKQALIAAAHPGKRVTPWFQDEARVGQKGRTCHAWWLRGQRPPGVADKRFSFASVFAAMQPATSRSSCLVLPEVSTAAMQAFPDSFSATLAPHVHAALVVDGAGWHVSLDLRVPGNMTLVPLPPYAPGLNPVERGWLHLRQRLRSLTSVPWLPQVGS